MRRLGRGVQSWHDRLDPRPRHRAGRARRRRARRALAGDELAGSGETDADGRIRELADGGPGTYRIVFRPPSPFFRRVELEVELGEGHHHIPLLVSSYACATYRGS